MDVIKSKNDTPIRLAEERWFHITEEHSEIAGYSSPEEFIVHALEKEISKLEEAENEDEVKKRLKGLGYIS